MDWANFDSKKQAAVDLTVAIKVTVSCTECGENLENNSIVQPEKETIHVQTPPCKTCFPESHGKWKKRQEENENTDS